MSFFNGLLGKIFSQNSEVDLGNGINFTDNLRAELNPATGRVDVYVDGPQGPQGDTGETGPQGATGATGTIASSTSIIIGADAQRAAVTGVVEIAQNSNTSAFSATAASALRGAGLTVASSKLAVRRRPRYAGFQDYFTFGGTASGQIGDMGWSLVGNGTPAYARASGAQMGSTARGSLSTSGASNDRASLTTGDTESRVTFMTTDLVLAQFAITSATNTSKRLFMGFSSTFATEPASVADCLGIYFDSAVSANYRLISRSGSAGSPSDTGVAMPTAAHLITIHQPTVGTINFYNGNTLLGTINSGLSSAAMNFGIRVETLTASARSITVGYIGLECTAAGVFDDDTFLEA